MKTIRVLVVCATAMATSTMAAYKLEEEFHRRHIPVQVEKGRITDMMALIEQTHPDIVVATAVVKNSIGAPCFDGVPLLSGIGLDRLYEDIFKCVETLQKNSA